MTAQRQERYGWRPGIAFFAPAGRLFCRASALILTAPGRDHRAGGGEPLFRPCHRGLRPRRLFHRSPGRPGACPISRPREAGAVWRFRNEGNRASFVAHPEIYGPQFGGYDPVDLGRGVTYAGNPRFWVIARPAALSVRPRGKPRRLRRRSRALPEGRDRALAGARAGILGAVAVRRMACDVTMPPPTDRPRR